MTIQSYIKSTLILALAAISLGGLLLHLRIHPASQNSSNLLPVVSGILSVVVVPLLFSNKKTIGYGYTLNGFLVIIGSIAMAHFSIVRWAEPFSWGALVLKTTLPDIVILWTKLFLGKAILDLEFFGYYPDRNKVGKTYRYPNAGWWVVHFAAVSIVYTVGNLLWR